jgi:hypothetical protein
LSWPELLARPSFSLLSSLTDATIYMRVLLTWQTTYPDAPRTPLEANLAELAVN